MIEQAYLSGQLIVVRVLAPHSREREDENH
jgi:hypothetical protein